jgi:hypothetical protein
MKNKLFFALALLFSAPAFSLESVYVGGQFGQVFLTGGATSHANALGFGADLGFRTNPVLDVVFRTQFSSHTGGGGLSLWANTLSADFLVSNFYDIEWFIGAGPGFYQFASTATSGRFGLHAETHADLAVTEMLKVGLGMRYHAVFSPAADEGSFFTVMMRLGFSFGTGH